MLNKIVIPHGNLDNAGGTSIVARRLGCDSFALLSVTVEGTGVKPQASYGQQMQSGDGSMQPKGRATPPSESDTILLQDVD